MCCNISNSDIGFKRLHNRMSRVTLHGSTTRWANWRNRLHIEFGEVEALFPMTSNNVHLTYLKTHFTVPPLEWENSAVESPLSTCVRVWRKQGLLHIFLRPCRAGQISGQICVTSLHMIITVCIMGTADRFLCWQFAVKPIVNVVESRFHILSGRMPTRRHSVQPAN